MYLITWIVLGTIVLLLCVFAIGAVRAGAEADEQLEKWIKHYGDQDKDLL